MAWNVQREAFLDQLENRLNDSLSVNNIALKNKFFDNYMVIKGRKFLQALEGLRNILDKKSHNVITYLLLTATRCVKDPTADNIATLKSHYHLLQQLLNENKKYNKTVVATNLFFNSIFTVAGFVASVAGFAFMNQAIASLAGITAGAMFLSIGPWGLLALGVGLAILGTAIAVIAASEAIEDGRFLKDKQAKNIGEFVSFLDNPNNTLEEEMPELNHVSLGGS
ncbi:Uncharacterised protein [Legionella busanensis]|uniref:Uncharacterized protein n=1 Tax=Legionella busanensis TaxID=190655 RepID=A0A378JJC9_9GAMM|nr:hypothetical protein [Legionella busanensis]STX51416.1 Uncharacterised protein [Legionella busanensis]